jgi:hypothetical protein
VNEHKENFSSRCTCFVNEHKERISPAESLPDVNERFTQVTSRQQVDVMSGSSGAAAGYSSSRSSTLYDTIVSTLWICRRKKSERTTISISSCTYRPLHPKKERTVYLGVEGVQLHHLRVVDELGVALDPGEGHGGLRVGVGQHVEYAWSQIRESEERGSVS